MHLQTIIYNIYPGYHGGLNTFDITGDLRYHGDLSTIDTIIVHLAAYRTHNLSFITKLYQSKLPIVHCTLYTSVR